MNFHKSIPVLAKKVEEAKNKDEAIKVVEEFLKSYHYQTDMGIKKLNAFENSILNPTLKFDTRLAKKIVNLKKIKQSRKKMFLYKHHELIVKLKSDGATLSQIAKYLNRHKTPRVERTGKNDEGKKIHTNDEKRKIMKFNKMDISRFLKERDIK